MTTKEEAVRMKLDISKVLLSEIYALNIIYIITYNYINYKIYFYIIM